MVDRLVIDLQPDGHVVVNAWPAGNGPRRCPAQAAAVIHPLGDEDQEDLRWYLEDYLLVPYGEYAERGPAIATAFARWGEEMFEALLGTGEARFIYRWALAQKAEVVCRSSSAELLALPWELLRDPARPAPVAVDLGAFSRSISDAELAEASIAGDETLRVLMVISRPGGTGDVGYRMIARPLLERLHAVRGRVDVHVLRPPTMEALRDALTAAASVGRPFQIVHFDGHGALTADEGVLVFEGAHGGPDLVRASAVAEVLAAAGVPVVVLNACQSAAVGKQLEAAVTTRMLHAGIPSVVAMAYKVYAVAAAEFMASFYERLFAGAGVAEAVTAGRRRLLEHDGRPSPKGLLPLSDWVVPVHYLTRDVRFPDLRSERIAGAPLDDLLDHAGERSSDEPEALSPVGSFVGRDALFYELEIAAATDGVVILHGAAGTGKSELAKAFGRWWRDTGALANPERLLVHSFEPGVASFGLDGVVADIGMRMAGPDFARLDAAGRRADVQRRLAEERMLLVWDNFETVHSMPDVTGATAPLDAAECDELRAFVHSIAAGARSALIVTSRSEEGWLGSVRRIEVGGLTRDEAVEYAEHLLAPLPGVAPRRAKPEFAALQEWLAGHPLTMRVVLPQLATTEPAALLGALQGSGESAVPGHLEAGLMYSFEHMDPAARRLLVIVCLFHAVADVDVLGVLDTVDDVPARFAGADRAAWAATLESAAAVGLLSRLPDGMYRIHPALPAFLARRWREQSRGEYEHERAASMVALMSVHGLLAQEVYSALTTGDAQRALAVMDNERQTFGAFLRFAVEGAHWRDAARLAQALDRYLDIQGLDREAAAWVELVLAAVGQDHGARDDLDDDAGRLWLQLMSSRADRHRDRHELDLAERDYRTILDVIGDRPGNVFAARAAQGLGAVALERDQLEDAERFTRHAARVYEELDEESGQAVAYHELGWVHEKRGQVADAERSYTQALEINIRLGDQSDAAINLLHLGRLAENDDRLDVAEDRFTEAVALATATNARPLLARLYHHLGLVARALGHDDVAEDWFGRALEIKEWLADRPRIADTYEELGLLALDRGQDGAAESWFRKALEIKDGLGSRRDVARLHHHLGRAAYARGDVERACARFEQAFELAEEVGVRELAALVSSQLGDIACTRSDYESADRWLSRAVAPYEELGDFESLAALYEKLGYVAHERGRTGETEHWYGKHLALAQAAGDRRAEATGFWRLGVLAAQQDRYGEAMESLVRFLAIHEAMTPDSHVDLEELLGATLRWVTSVLGLGALELSWREVTGSPLPDSIRRLASSPP